jgi:SRSO17 transposase
MVNNAVGVVYSHLHHFLSESKEATEIDDRRLKVTNQCDRTKINKEFCLIVDDSGHRKSGYFTFGIGQQYLGEIGKLDNGLVAGTTHLYDGQKNVPLDVDIY